MHLDGNDEKVERALVAWAVPVHLAREGIVAVESSFVVVWVGCIALVVENK